MAPQLKEQLAQFHTSHPSWPGSQQRVGNLQLSTYPLLTSMISPLEVQDELLPHRLVSEGNKGGGWEQQQSRVGNARVPGGGSEHQSAVAVCLKSNQLQDVLYLWEPASAHRHTPLALRAVAR